ncbi:MAG: NAD(P)(+) transhydrogenase (Re/Si-specific) subunit beta, partial [Planctomycetota bacterium]
MDAQIIRDLFYILASVLFIFGIKGLTHPRTAVRGNLLGALGMLLAIVVTVIDKNMIGWGWIIAGVVIGGGIGAVLAIKIQMTGMPQMVALFNGFGGVASVFVAGAVLHEYINKAVEKAEQLGVELDVMDVIANPLAGMGANPTQVLVATIASGIIGGVTFSGSIVAWAKLQEVIPGNPYTNPLLKVANAVCAIVAIGLGVILFNNPEAAWLYWMVAVVALALGVFLVMPIGGADMPVVIALLNSYSGLAAAATGFVINNNVLIVAGSLVGASGLILTKIMCVAMNRSLTNVLFGVMAEVGEGPSADEV